jgi:N-acetyl sugar amidotransferase
MNYCSNCLNVDTRPNSNFPKKNLCSACDYYFKTKNVNYEERIIILNNIVKKFPKNPKRRYDCIIGVSGGKDSTRQALWIRDKLNLRPLLVCLGYPPEKSNNIGPHNLSNLINLGFDVHCIYYSPKQWKDLARYCFRNFGNYLRHSEQAIVSAVPRLAIKYKIPVIFWGENPGDVLGDSKTQGKTGYDGNNVKFMNTVAGGKLDWLLKAGYKLNKIFPFEYPQPEEFDKHKIQIIYLNWFWRDWSIVNNAIYSGVEGLRIRQDTFKNTQDLYGVFSLDEDWVTLNQMIKFYKYGFGRVSDYVNEEIRLGRISRDNAIKLVEKFDGTVGKKYIKSFCDYIEISVNEFWKVVRGVTNKDLFKIDNKKKITRKYKVGKGLIND